MSAGSGLLPRFGGSELDTLVSTVDYVHNAVRRDMWSIERVEAEFGRRTCLDLLDDGTTFAYAPCPERTLLAAAVLLEQELQPTMVYHERRVFGFGPSTAHFAIEVQLSDGPWMFDFGTWESRLLPGGYYYADEWEETLALDRIVINTVDPAKDTVQTVVGDRMTAHLDLGKKRDWYQSQIEHPRPGILQDRTVFAKEMSLVNAI